MIYTNNAECEIIFLRSSLFNRTGRKFFFFFYPHTLTFRLKRPVYRGFSGEGKCEGKLSPLTLALTLPAGKYPVRLSIYRI